MKYIKLITITLIAATVMFFAMAFISPPTVTIERGIAIVGKQDSVLTAFSQLDWNQHEKVERNIYGDSLLQFQFYTKKPELFVEGWMKFNSNADTTFVTYINKVELPVTMRLMQTKITEVFTPEMDNDLYEVKQEVEKKN